MKSKLLSFLCLICLLLMLLPVSALAASETDASPVATPPTMPVFVQPEETAPAPQGDSTGAVIGVSLGAVFAVAVIVIAVLNKRK